MEGLDFNPLQVNLNHLALKLVTLLLVGAIAYIVVFKILRMLKIPKPFADFLAVMALLFVMYYSFVNGYIS